MQAMNRELDISFSLGLEPGEIETAIEMLAAGRVSTEPMITHVIGIDELPECIRGAVPPEQSDQSDGRFRRVTICFQVFAPGHDFWNTVCAFPRTNPKLKEESKQMKRV